MVQNTIKVIKQKREGFPSLALRGIDNKKPKTKSENKWRIKNYEEN